VTGELKGNCVGGNLRIGGLLDEHGGGAKIDGRNKNSGSMPTITAAMCGGERSIVENLADVGNWGYTKRGTPADVEPGRK